MAFPLEMDSRPPLQPASLCSPSETTVVLPWLGISVLYLSTNKQGWCKPRNKTKVFGLIENHPDEPRIGFISCTWIWWLSEVLSYIYRQCGQDAVGTANFASGVFFLLGCGLYCQNPSGHRLFPHHDK